MFAPPPQYYYPQQQQESSSSKKKPLLKEGEGGFIAKIKSSIDTRNIILFIIISIVAVIAIIGLYRLKTRILDWPVYPFSVLETTPPFTLSATAREASLFSSSSASEKMTQFGGGGGASIYGRGSSAPPPLVMSRPFNKEKPGDYYGTVNITKSRSATITVSSEAGYFEVVIYKYPDWEVAYSETNISEIFMDFLPFGLYSVIVFSIAPVEGAIEMSHNLNRQKPINRSHRTTSREVAEFRNDAAASAVASAAPLGAKESLRITSAPTFVWPGPVHTKVETVFAVIPDDSIAAFISVPSYGYIVDGADEHLGSIVHEGNNTAIYRVVAQPPSLSGGSIIEREDSSGGVINSDNRFISITVVYPDMSKDALVSPKMTVYVYSPNTSSTTNLSSAAASCIVEEPQP